MQLGITKKDNKKALYQTVTSCIEHDRCLIGPLNTERCLSVSALNLNNDLYLSQFSSNTRYLDGKSSTQSS